MTLRRVHCFVNTRTEEGLAQLIARSEAIHRQLWSRANALADAARDSEIDALFIAALNVMIARHTSRVVTGIHDRIPPASWGVLLLVSGLALAFSAVLVLIFELDRSPGGLVKVSQKPLIELKRSMQPDRP